MKLPVKMRSRKCIAIFTLLAVIIAVAIHLFPAKSPPEPVYEGKAVSAWLEMLALPTANSNGIITVTLSSEQLEHARMVLKKIGPEAIPFIILKLTQNDSPLRNKYRDVWPHLPVPLQNNLPVPKTIKYGIGDAAGAFDAIGTNAIPYLLPELHNENPAVRQAVMDALVRFPQNSIPTKQMVFICRNELADSSPWVRYVAASELERIGPAGSNAIPELITTLQPSEADRFQTRVPVSDRAMGALARMGPLATKAVPALSNLMHQSTSGSATSLLAASALWDISSNKGLVLPVLTNALSATAFSSPELQYGKRLAIRTLGDMGPQAKEAFPALVETLKKSTSDIRFALTNALVKIDPVAGAKVIEENPQNYNP